MAQMGRPKIENPRTNKVSLRVSDEHLEKIKKYAADHNMTIADMLKKGLDMLMEEVSSVS